MLSLEDSVSRRMTTVDVIDCGMTTGCSGTRERLT